ncbi:LPS sulfotransferase NodH [Roseibium hamelinense]|uniref:LPS sulfotransferase NodH n=1 Tax=Roseibium hamelinense TaxID=150831 RepID=A0A562TIW0_9HYPH|nr:Stf0 family sulfotransferase [Roseibium hamelinense]MTI42737.1 sulfotransferase [Roseibium hamelinense]TWI93383.1 LPS sulfotransferase NodH [Roseibium hamelinense]
MFPPNAYILCTSPRSGSTLLCKLLKDTGLAGNPKSYFHKPDVSEWCSYLSLPPKAQHSTAEHVRETFAAAVAQGRDGGPLFGLRLQRHSFSFFMDQLAFLYPGSSSDAERLEAAFGSIRFIHLTREDKAAQAVSFVKAEQTGLWHKAPDGTELERLSPPSPPAYDAGALGEAYHRFTAFDRDWTAWFKRESIKPIKITYSELEADPPATLARVLEALCLDPEAAKGITPGTAKLADKTSAEWTLRLKADMERAQARPVSPLSKSR